jgi:hypothetical protein
MTEENYTIGVFAGFNSPAKVTAEGDLYQQCLVVHNNSLIKVNIFGEKTLGLLRVGSKLKLFVTKPKKGIWKGCVFINAEPLNPAPHRDLQLMNFSAASGFEVRNGLSK